MRNEWQADREKIQRVNIEYCGLYKIMITFCKDIRREFQSEKEKMQMEAEKQRNEMEKKLQYGKLEIYTLSTN